MGEKKEGEENIALEAEVSHSCKLALGCDIGIIEFGRDQRRDYVYKKEMNDSK